MTFDIDTNGILKVSAKDMDTGKEQSIVITADDRMSDAEIEQAIRDAQSYAGQDQIRRDAIELLDESRKLCNETELSLKNAGKTLDRAAKKQIKADSTRLQKLIGRCRLEKVTEAELAEIREAKQILQNSVDTLMRR